MNATKILKTKSSLSIEKNIMKCEKINEMSFNKLSVSSYKSKNGIVMGWSRFQFLAIRVGEIGAIQCNLWHLKKNTLNFSIRRFSGKLFSPIFFPNKDILYGSDCLRLLHSLLLF